MKKITLKLMKQFGVTAKRVEQMTEYARSLGYTGEKDIVVYDGHVVSHQNKNWFEFCDEIRAKCSKRIPC